MTEENEFGSVNAEVGKKDCAPYLSPFRIHTSELQYLSSVF
jgi:hypothetical protein